MRTEKLGADKYIDVQKIVPFALLSLFAVFKTAALVMFDTKTSASFLTAFQGQAIGTVLLAQSVLVFAIGALLLFLKEKNDKMPSYAMAGAGGVLILLHFFAAYADAPFLPAVFMTWQEGYRLILEVCFWITAVRFGLFSKKMSLMLFLCACQIFAAIGAAAFVRLTLLLGNTSVLVPCSALLAFLCAACADILADNGSVPFSKEHLFSGQTVGHSGAERRHLKLKHLLFFTAACIAFAGGIFNYSFWKNSVVRYGDDYDSLLKMFTDIAFATALTWALLVIFALLRKNSFLKLSFLFLIPAALLLACLTPFTGIFGMIATAKVMYDAVVYRFKEPVFQIFPHIISQRIAFKISIFRKFAVEPLALGASAVVLMALERYNKTGDVVVLTGAMAVVITTALLFLKASYVKNACLTLKRRLWRGGTVMISGKKLKGLLQRDLCSSNQDDAIYALRVLENAQYFSFMKKLEQALSHERKKVREFALSRLEFLNFTPALPAVKQCALQDVSRHVRCRAVRVMCHLGTSLEEETALTMLNHPDLREGALIGLLSEKAEGMFAAIALMNELSLSPAAQDRAMVARVIGEVGNPDFYRPLQPLLNDIDLSVRKEALEATGKLLHTALIPSVLAAFYDAYLRETAVKTLGAYRETAFPEIEREIRMPHNPIQYRNLLIKTVSQVNTPAADDFLFDMLTVNDRRIRFMILRFLCLKQYKASGKNHSKIRLYLYDEIEWITSLLASLEVLQEEQTPDMTAPLKILKSALEVEIEYARERIVLLIGAAHPEKEISRLTNSLTLSKEKEREQRLSLVEDVLSGELKSLCLPLFKDVSVKEKLTVLRPHFLPPVMPFYDRLTSFLHLPSGDGSEWLKTCAIYVLGHMNDRRCVDSLLILLRDADPIIRETTIWALGNILTDEEVSSMLSGCVYDPFLPAARMARFVLNKTRKVAI